MIHIARGKTSCSLTWTKGCQHFYISQIQPGGRNEMGCASKERLYPLVVFFCITLMCFQIVSVLFHLQAFCSIERFTETTHALSDLMLSPTWFPTRCGLSLWHAERERHRSVCIQNKNSLYYDLPSGAPHTWISQGHSQNIRARK